MILHKKGLLAVVTSMVFAGNVFAACSAAIDMNSNKITNLGTATDSADAISLGQMESVLATYVAGGSLTTTVGTVTDSQGNEYTTRQIGNQTWMTQNLRNTTGLTQGTSGNWADGSNAYYAFGGGTIDEQNDSAADREKYGAYYQWNAAMNGSTTEGAQGMCPTGWHVPSDAEWKTLESTIAELNSVNIASATYLACIDNEVDGYRFGATSDGSQCADFNLQLGSILKSLYFDPMGGILAGIRATTSFMVYRDTRAYFWSSTGSGGSAIRRYMDSDESGVYRSVATKVAGFPVRCVKD